jgi:hypothetical protein
MDPPANRNGDKQLVLVLNRRLVLHPRPGLAASKGVDGRPNRTG